MSQAEIERLQQIVNDTGRPAEERQKAAEHILRLTNSNALIPPATDQERDVWREYCAHYGSHGDSLETFVRSHRNLKNALKVLKGE